MISMVVMIIILFLFRGSLNSSKNGLTIVKKNPISTDIINRGNFDMFSQKIYI